MKNKNQISLAGEFAVLSQLALRGFDASLTLGNTKGVDILVLNPSNNKMFKVEVKTSERNKPSTDSLLGKSYYWIMDKKHETTITDLFYCFVNLNQKSNHFDYFIVPSKIVAKYILESHQYYLKKKPENKNGAMRKFCLGFNNEAYPIETPITEKYENNWGLLN